MSEQGDSIIIELIKDDLEKKGMMLSDICINDFITTARAYNNEIHIPRSYLGKTHPDLKCIVSHEQGHISNKHVMKRNTLGCVLLLSIITCVILLPFYLFFLYLFFVYIISMFYNYYQEFQADKYALKFNDTCYFLHMLSHTTHAFSIKTPSPKMRAKRIKRKANDKLLL